MPAILVYSDNKHLACELVTAARLIGDEVFAVAINDEQLALDIADLGVKVFSIKEDMLSLADTAALASAIKQVAARAGASTVLLSSNRRLREVAGRLAQILDADCLTNINSLNQINGKLICTRNSLGGATVATYEIDIQGAVIALSSKVYPPACTGSGGTIENYQPQINPTVKLLENRSKYSEGSNIENAKILVAAGMGFKNQADLVMAESLATALGGVVGCSKPIASDRKWMSEERVIGLSGKICKPDLAILLGVSAQVQFAVGIRDAHTIVVVNDDENAAAASLADYLLVGDLYQVVPALIRFYQ
jgi:electron transfer flavoprotein alpha subunit